MEVHYISSQYQLRYMLFGVLGHPLSYISSASLNREFMQLFSLFFLCRPLFLINQQKERGMVWGGRREEGSGQGTRVYLWRIHVDIWQIQPTFKIQFLLNHEVAQSCPILCNPMDCSLPGSSVHGILQARMLEWVAIPFYRGPSQPREILCYFGSNVLVPSQKRQKFQVMWTPTSVLSMTLFQHSQRGEK